ncbi:hypothetical protein [Actinomadura sp. 7K534]|uniref:hypothetical protein n=1 Tax=Actinomadura sp. 7K534 TaxID=2530366 RepID=UPI00105098C4|nr:hypothetical protein [Actinomadura sp. 7K534]TDB97438.1 hypothetical protein E1266_06435 [Actinomadura sp. 7K534]
MTRRDGAPADGPLSLRKERPPEPRPGPAWLVVPVRVVALVVLVPLRLVHDLAVQAGRGVRAVWNRLMRAPGRLARLIGRMLHAVWRGLYRWLLAPIGRLLAAIARGIGAVLDLLVVRPVRWLAVVVIYGFLRWLGRGTAHLARWTYRTLLVPIGAFLAMIGRGFAMIGRGLAWLADRILLRPLLALGRGLHWLLTFTGRAIALLFTGILAGLRLLANVLVVIPALFLWRYLLRPPLLGLLWLGRAVQHGLAWAGRGLLAVLGALAGAAAWLGRVLLLRPVQAVWRYVLAPIIAGIVAAWRLAGRVLRWLWRTLVVLPVRTLVVEPARRVGRSVLRPVGHEVRGVWRASVRDPLRAARRTVRETSRDIRLQLRRTFRGQQ